MVSRPADQFAERRFRLGLGALALLGAIGRFLHLVLSKVDEGSLLEQGDAFWYGSTAWNLAEGEFFRNYFTGEATADHPPLTSLVLAPAALLGDESTWALRLTMVALGTATIVVIGLAGRALAGRRAGLVAAATATLMPALWTNDVLLMAETPAALLIAGTIWAGIVLAQRSTTGPAVLAGALCGLAALTRAELGLLLPFMVWPILVVARDLAWRRKLALGAAATAATVAVIAPWTLVNQTRFAEPVLISTNDGITLAGANCDANYAGSGLGGWSVDPCVIEAYARIEADKPAGPASGRDTASACSDPLQTKPPCLDASQVSKELRAQGVSYVAAHLTDLPRVVLARNGLVWGFYRMDRSLDAAPGEGRQAWSTALAFGVAWLLIPVSVAGLVVLRRREVSLIPLLAPLAVVLVTTSAFSGIAPRFRLPWDVASCLLVGVTITSILDRARRPAG